MTEPTSIQLQVPAKKIQQAVANHIHNTLGLSKSEVEAMIEERVKREVANYFRRQGRTSGEAVIAEQVRLYLGRLLTKRHSNGDEMDRYVRSVVQQEVAKTVLSKLDIRFVEQQEKNESHL